MIKKLSILAMLALLLAACGTTSQDSGGTATNQATAVEAVEVTEQPTQGGDEAVVDDVSAEVDLDLGFSMVPGVDFFSDILMSPVAEWNCSGTASGNTSDADGDGIATDATYNVTCSKSFDFAGITAPVDVTRQGSLTVRDQDDNDPTSGYYAKGDYTYSYTMLGQDISFVRSFERNWQGNASEGYSFDHSHTWAWSVAGEEHKVVHTHSGSYMPDDPQNPFASGELSETGSYEHYLDGLPQMKVAEKAELHLNNNCSPTADSGTVEFDVNNDGTYDKTIEFTGCGEYQVQ
ncbi:hypothetical protein [Oceanithermus sp.]